MGKEQGFIILENAYQQASSVPPTLTPVASTPGFTSPVPIPGAQYTSTIYGPSASVQAPTKTHFFGLTVFKNHLGRNMEVYVNDMMVKSKTSKEHITNLEEAFLFLQKYGMKLNPKKCKFGVSSKKFLGFIIIFHGIEANSEKIKAFVNMLSP
uniref:Reverse transcriptase domain-containing protein n=1 Tax=Cannabis sativa TaxID=3483 RepID=A0A803P467_CANSA